ncbi:hypothetical protein ACKLNO_11175 [Neisseriaceae bacterium B1]
MHPILSALIGATGGAFTVWLIQRNTLAQQWQQLHQQADEIIDLQDENHFLRQELEIAVSISKRLNEALAEKFAGVYSGYGFRQPENTSQAIAYQEQQNSEKEALTIGNTTYFIAPEIAAEMEYLRQERELKQWHC